MWIDTHAHLCDPLLADRTDEILQAMSGAGVSAAVEVGFDYESSRAAVALALKDRRIYAAVGIHPSEAEKYTQADLYGIEALCKNNPVVALGEIGLDYHYDYDRKKQNELFIEQLTLADVLKLPIIIHLRDAYAQAEQILNENARLLAHGVLFHCYSGSKEMLARFRAFDPYYAFGGAVTFKNNNRAEVYKAIELSRLLTETDSPYMAPVPFRGKPNTPLNVPLIGKKMAEELGVSESEAAKITSDNARRFFHMEEL